MTTRNITKAYRLASTQDRIDGEGWYAAAKAQCASLDSDVSRAVGIVALLSPMVPWDRNVIIAKAMYDGKRSGLCLPENEAKVARVLDGGENVTDVLSGAKVRAFYYNIMGIDTDEAVTIDRHAIMVAEGKRIPSKGLKFTAAANRKYADEYRRAARILSKEYGRPLTPAQVQATVWVWWRRTGQSFHMRMETV